MHPGRSLALFQNLEADSMHSNTGKVRGLTGDFMTSCQRLEISIQKRNEDEIFNQPTSLY